MAKLKDYIAAFRVLGVCGDINFLDYGGMLVVENQGCIEGWHFYPNPGNDDECWLNSFGLDQLKAVGDVATRTDTHVPVRYDNSWPYPPTHYSEWFEDSIPQMCQYADITVEEFWEAITSDNPLHRAGAYDVIGSYHGFHELTAGNERTIRVPEWRKRLALPCWRARKKGITVYT